MSTQVLEANAKLDDGDDLDHIICWCNPDISLCGADVSDQPLTDWDGVDLTEVCVVCLDLEDLGHCRRCKRSFG